MAKQKTPEQLGGAKPLLLHICCAPCGAGCVNRPETAHFPGKVRLFFSNSNLDSAEEFERRLAWVRKLAELYDLDLAVDPYDHEAWRQAVAGFEGEPEGGARCRRCFAFSLARAAAHAGTEYDFATTLTVSPRKSSSTIFDVGSRWTNFLPIDFKKRDGYLNGTRIARQYCFYRQNYCGCEFSKAAGTSGDGGEKMPQ